MIWGGKYVDPMIATHRCEVGNVAREVGWVWECNTLIGLVGNKFKYIFNTYVIIIDVLRERVARSQT